MLEGNPFVLLTVEAPRWGTAGGAAVRGPHRVPECQLASPPSRTHGARPEIHLEELTLWLVCRAGAEHGRDPDAPGLRVLRAAAGDGEEQRLLRVHPAPHRPLRHPGLRQVR